MDTNFLDQYNVDTVINSIGKITNEQPLLRFFNDLIINKASIIRILVFSIEGELIIKTIRFDGREISYTKDATMTMDKILQRYSGNRLKKENDGGMTVYNLYQDNEFITRMISYQ